MRRALGAARFMGTAALCACAFLLPSAGAAMAATAHAGRPVMGTVLEVTVVADEPIRARELADGCVDIARHWDDVLTTWRPQGELERLNLSAGLGPIPIGGDLWTALELMLGFARATDGAFDPGVGGVVATLRRGEAPSGDQPRLRHVGDVLTLEDGNAALSAGARIDAGGIGKGIALDAIATHLRAQGATAWFLDFGGSSQLAHGRPETTQSWRVLVAGESRGSVHGLIRLQDASLSTSRALRASDPAGAIVDPRTGAPVAPPRLGTVLAPDAATAEAWSKVLIVQGRDGVALAAAAGLEALYEDSTGTVRTPGFPLEPARATW